MFRLSTPNTLATTFLLIMDYDDANMHIVSLAMTSLDFLQLVECVLMPSFMFCNTSYLCFITLGSVR